MGAREEARDSRGRYAGNNSRIGVNVMIRAFDDPVPLSNVFLKEFLGLETGLAPGFIGRSGALIPLHCSAFSN